MGQLKQDPPGAKVPSSIVFTTQESINAAPARSSIWENYQATCPSCSSCKRIDYAYQGTLDDLVRAIVDALEESHLTSTVLANRRVSRVSGMLSYEDAQFIRAAFDSWGAPNSLDDDAVKGDIGEAKFLSLRKWSTSGQPVVHRPKKDSLSSKTSGWDVLEVFLDEKPWFILWEVKSTDKGPESQSHKAVSQLMERSGPWLAKLSHLLEKELVQTCGQETADFCGRLHEMALKEDDSFHLGVAVVVDQSNLPRSSFEIFPDGTQEHIRDAEHCWGVFIGIPGFQEVRTEVVKWILQL